ncbi:MAG: recombinase family protein [Defluviitaleaceae bacterium]|nr:recombinase family protein [Defluviitaleaceae bacterium]
MSKIIAIYVRRSVSDNDNNSLSIDSQKVDCVKSLRGGEEYRIYCDEGKSAKGIKHRPAFMQMMSDAKEGLLERIIVKKYDRFSRNMRDYLNVTDELDKYGVGVSSLSEPFNTTTKEGRLMRNNLLSFAEFERETIAERVADAYNTRAHETGFYLGGQVCYGYEPERRKVDGKAGSVLVPSDKAHVIQKAYEIYKNPDTSLADIVDYFKDNDIEVNIPRRARAYSDEQAIKANGGMSNMDRSHFSKLLDSPLYVKADKDVYQYLVSKGYEILDDIEAFNGVHGLFRHSKIKGKQATRDSGEYFYIKVGYHEGLVDSDTWLAVQDKKSHNKRIPNNISAKNSWLVGLTKCGHCGYSFTINYSWNKAKTVLWRYYIDHGKNRSNGCVHKRVKTKPDAVEEAVFNAMKERLENIKIAKIAKSKPDSEAETIKTAIIRADSEIRELMDKLAKADDVLFSYIQGRIKEIHSRKSDLEAKLRAKARKHKEIDTAPLDKPLSRWDSLTTEEKHALATTMIDVIYVSDERGIEINFSI